LISNEELKKPDFHLAFKSSEFIYFYVSKQTSVSSSGPLQRTTVRNQCAVAGATKEHTKPQFIILHLSEVSNKFTLLVVGIICISKIPDKDHIFLHHDGDVPVNISRLSSHIPIPFLVCPKNPLAPPNPGCIQLPFDTTSVIFHLVINITIHYRTCFSSPLAAFWHT